jgi:neurotransmitter:Na+ symporter, NSS family
MTEAAEERRDQWGSKLGFIMAAIGSAIGLGNIWRYPYVVYDNGGGAFLLPYFIAIATAGIPILVMEYALGNRSRGSAPVAYRGLSQRWEWLGWWQAAVTFLIGTYYMVIIGWVLAYIYFSFGAQWGSDTEGFFLGNFVGLSDSFWSVGGLQLKVFIPFVIAWAIVYWLMIRGVSRGIQLSAMVLIPLMALMMLIIVIRGITLPGSGEGLTVLFTPDFGELLNPQVWIAAYGQVFFSIGVAFSIMIAYASYLPRRSELPNSGFIVALSNSGFEFFAAIGVFSVLGFLAVQQNAQVNEVVGEGVILAFVTFPQIINQLPALNALFGFLFFGALLFAGLTSAVSILEVGVIALRDKFGLSRTRAVNVVCGLAFLIGLIYLTKGGLYYLDTIDHFINNYGLVLSGLIEVILVAWVVRQLRDLQQFTNENAYIRLGSWWVYSLSIITPVILIVITAFNIYNEFANPYEGYPASGLIVLGGGAVALAIVLGFVFQALRWRRESEEVAR